MDYTTFKNLKDKTNVLENSANLTCSVTWRVFNEIEEVELIPVSESGEPLPWNLIDPDSKQSIPCYIGHSEFSVDDPRGFLNAEEIPVELFNHQLLDYGNDDEALLRFMSEWGLLYSPIRNDPSCLDFWGEDYSRSWLAALATDMLSESYPDCDGYLVSKQEASLTFRILQETVLLLRGCLIASNKNPKSWYEDKYEDLLKICPVLNAASCNPMRMRYEIQGEINPNRPLSLSSTGLLTSAICNQLIAAVANEEVPWRKCACEGCDVIFKYSQTNSSSPNSDSAYCCKKHADRQRKRNQRKKK